MLSRSCWRVVRTSSKSLPRGFSSLSWAHVPLGPKDAIFGLGEKFAKDPDPNKLNLSLGAYRDESGSNYVLPVVAKAEKMAVAENCMEYLPIIGSSKFLKLASELLFGPECPFITEKRLASMQTISGTGALRVAFDFLYRFTPNASDRPAVWVSDPTYANHLPILKAVGFDHKVYRYFNSDTNGLDFSGMLEDIRSAPEGAIILLHAVAHNPTGVDPKPAQWAEISKVVKQRKLLPVFDCAYQGFASGDVEADAFGVRQFVNDGHTLLVCQSFAKNFGLYGHRAGAVHISSNSSEEKDQVESQLKIIARTQYSNPPIHGSRIVETVLGDEQLRQEWLEQVKGMADRINGARLALKTELLAQGSTRNWDHLTDQIGMFCYTGMTPDQCQKMVDEWHIYMLKSGRISMAGVNQSNAKYIAEGIHAVTQ